MQSLKTTALAAVLAAALALPSAASVIYSVSGTGGFPVFVLDENGERIEEFETDDDGELVLDADGQPISIGFRTENVPLSFDFAYSATDFLTDYTLVPAASLTNALIADGSTYFLTGIGFDPRPVNQFGGSDTFVDVKYDSSPETGITGGGFLFFQAGALRAPGVYSSQGFPVGTPDAGNFGTAAMTVVAAHPEPDPSVIPLPAGLPLLLAGLGALGLLRRRRG
jgi:hypothetical protein